MALPQFSLSKWDALSDKSRWDIISAVRGPDLYGSEITKWFTTAVIRWVASTCLRPNGTSAMVNAAFPGILLPTDTSILVSELYQIVKKARAKHKTDLLMHLGNMEHFLQHSADAACLLGIPIYYLTTDKWKEVMGCGNLVRAIKMIHDATRPDEGEGFVNPLHTAILECKKAGY